MKPFYLSILSKLDVCWQLLQQQIELFVFRAGDIFHFRALIIASFVFGWSFKASFLVLILLRIIFSIAAHINRIPHYTNFAAKWKKDIIEKKKIIIYQYLCCES